MSALSGHTPYRKIWIIEECWTCSSFAIILPSNVDGHCWRHVPYGSGRHGHQGGVIRTAIALATGVRRTGDRVHSARVLGPCPHTQRGEPPPDHQVLSRLLPRQPHASLAGQGHPRATDDSAAGIRSGGRHPPFWRAAP